MITYSEDEQKAILLEKEQKEYWNGLREVFNKILQGIARNKTRSGERAIWELLQNAGDLCDSNAKALLRLTTDALIFQHYGQPFTLETLEDLIRQRSSKPYKTKVGRFGTGFMTTHVFNRKVFISGSCEVEHNGKRAYIPFNNFCLNRDFNSNEVDLFLEAADNALKDVNDFLKIPGSEVDNNPTKFTYPLLPEGVENISRQLKRVSKLLPYVLTFNDNIKECIIDNQYAKTQVSFTRVEEKQLLHQEKYSLYATYVTIEEEGKTKEDIIIYTLRNDDDTDRIVIPPLPLSYNNVTEIPSQFLYFPLLGSENFGTNFILHSKRLTPTEPRDAYEVPKDNKEMMAVYDANVNVLDEMFNMLFEYYNDYPEAQRNITEEFAIVTFKAKTSEQLGDKIDKIENNFYAELQQLFSSHLSTFSVIPYTLPQDAEVKYTSIRDGKVKVISPSLLSVLTETQINTHLPTIIKFASKVATLPCDNVLWWSLVAGSWDSNSSSWYVTLEDICAGIKNTSEDLLSFLSFLKDLGQTGTDLMKRYSLIPNREGVLCSLNTLRSGKSISDELYKKVRPIIREKANAIVDLGYEDIYSFTEYTRTNLRDDISSAIDKLKENTIGRRINYTSSPQLLDKLENTTTIKDILSFCSVYPTTNPESLRSEIMPVIAELYGISVANSCIPNEKLDDGAQPVDLYSRTFNFLVEHTMYFISTKNQDWLTTSEEHELNRARLLRFVGIYANSAKTNSENMERLKKYRIFPNQLGELCCLNDNKLQKNENIEDDVAELYLKVKNEDLKVNWVDNDFKAFVEFDEELPSMVGRRLEDTLRPYLDDKRKAGAEFNIIDKYESALLTIVNNLEKGNWKEYFDFFANETNLRNVSYELGTPEQKDALYKIKMNTNQGTLDRLAEIAENPNVILILDRAESAIRQAEEQQRQFNFTFAIGKLIEEEIGRSIGSALKVEFSQSVEEFTATDEQNGQDIIIRHNGVPVYYIECKAKWNFDAPAHMSSQQMKQAVREYKRYALCCIDCTRKGCSIPPNASSDEVIAASSDILAHTYVHTEIGDKFKSILEPLIHEEDKDKVLSNDAREQNIGVYSSLSCNIPYGVFAAGKQFNEFMALLKEQLLSCCN